MTQNKEGIEIQYHRLFGSQEVKDLELLLRLFITFKDDALINCNIRWRVERLTAPKELHISGSDSQ